MFTRFIEALSWHNYFGYVIISRGDIESELFAVFLVWAVIQNKINWVSLLQRACHSNRLA